MPTYPIARSLTVGGRTFTDAEMARFETGTTGVVLYGMGAATSGRWNTLRTSSGSAGYIVPAGKTLTMVAVITTCNSGSTIYGFIPCYGTTDVGQDGAAGPTGVVYLGGYSGVATMLGGGVAGIPSAQISTPVNFDVPANNYPCLHSVGVNNSFIVYCFIN